MFLLVSFVNNVIVQVTYARCAIDFTIHHGGCNDVTSHVKSKRHAEMNKAVSSMRSLTSHYRPQVSDQVIEAEVRWATFVAKHNLAFLLSDHATKLQCFQTRK